MIALPGAIIPGPFIRPMETPKPVRFFMYSDSPEMRLIYLLTRRRTGNRY